METSISKKKIQVHWVHGFKSYRLIVDHKSIQFKFKIDLHGHIVHYFLEAYTL